MNAFDATDARDAAVALVVGEGLIEKEWHAVNIVGIVHQLRLPGLTPVFAGGTSLSAAYDLTNRFSEDVDFKLLNTARQARPATINDIERFCGAARDAITQADYREIEDLFVRNDRFGFQRLCFAFEPLFEPAEAMRPHVQLEITPTDEDASNPEKRDVFTRISRLAKETADVAEVPCVQIIDTAADKISALTWRVLNRNREAEVDDPVLVRHIYDLAAMPHDPLATTRFKNLCLQRLRKDARERRSQGMIDSLNPVEAVQRMHTKLSNDPDYANEYDGFVLGMAFDSDPPAPEYTRALELLDVLIGHLSR